MRSARGLQAALDDLLTRARVDAPPARSEVEAVLTDGYALALELEAERLELTRQLDEHFSDAGEVLRLNREIARTTAQLRQVRGALTDAARRFGRNPLAEV
jgi:hypothetical protein